MTRIFHVLIFALLIQPVFSQTAFQSVLDSVTANNRSLEAGSHYSESMRLGARTGIYLPNPSVSYDRLSNSSGSYSEVVISQSFDFPTAYLQKSRIAALSVSQSDERFRQTKLGILTNTAQVYAEMIYINRKISVLTARDMMATQLLHATEKRLSTGDVNVIEANRVKSEIARVQSELHLALSRRESLMMKLAELNGGKAIMVTDTVYPVIAGFMVSDESANVITATDPLAKQLQTEVVIAGYGVGLQRSLSLPKLEVGYRMDTNSGQTYSGIHAGITIPLFENKNRVKLAKVQQLYTQEAVSAYKLELQSSITQLINEYNALQLSLKKMNEVFNNLSTPGLLYKAYSTGQISYTEFFTEY